MSRRHHRAVGLVAAVVAAGQYHDTGNAWAAGAPRRPSARPGPGVSACPGTVASVRAADSTMVVNRAYRFSDSRPKTVKFAMTSSTAVVGNGLARRDRRDPGRHAGAVTGTLAGGSHRVFATRVVIRR